MTIKAVGIQPVQLYAAPAYGQSGSPFRVTNLDEVNSVSLDSDLTITAQSTSLPQQATVTYQGNRDVWASSLSATTTVLVDVDDDSLTWDNPIGVQIALNALGLAKDSTVAGLPGLIQTMGAPPYILNLRSVGDVNYSAAGSPYTLVTFSGNSRVWYVGLSLAVATDASYAGGLVGTYAKVRTGSNFEIIACQANFGSPEESVASNNNLSLGGLPFSGGDTLVLDVNNAVNVTDAFIRASVTVLWSTP